MERLEYFLLILPRSLLRRSHILIIQCPPLQLLSLLCYLQPQSPTPQRPVRHVTVASKQREALLHVTEDPALVADEFPIRDQFPLFSSRDHR